VLLKDIPIHKYINIFRDNFWETYPAGLLRAGDFGNIIIDIDDVITVRSFTEL
jgi:hypothetical protein